MRLRHVSLLFVLCCGAALSEPETFERWRLVGKSNGVGDGELPSDEWALQRLDHFDANNPRTWWQRYQAFTTWFKHTRDTPVFLLIGGEGPASAAGAAEGPWMDYAQKYNAVLFQLEHRFYGESDPTGDLTVDSLRYLTSDQALADIAYFIQFINEKYHFHPSNKWVLFGGSYPGSLAAWARLRYPHLIHAAVSSSAPLLAHADFRGYAGVVRQALTASSKLCARNVHQAALALEHLLVVSKNNTALVSKFNLCAPLDLDNKHEVTKFAEYWAKSFEAAVQYNNNNVDTTYAPATTVDVLCQIMTNDSLGDLLDRYAAAKMKDPQRCNQLATYHDYSTVLRNVAFKDSYGIRTWFYQSCTEFGFFYTSGSKKDLFGSLINLQYFVDLCKDAFGDNFDMNRLNEGIKRTNLLYGHKNIEVSRVLFLQGSLDPWHVLGINESTNPDAPAIVIEGAAHCAEMYPSSPNDPPQLTAARERTAELIGQWLSEK